MARRHSQVLKWSISFPRLSDFLEPARKNCKENLFSIRKVFSIGDLLPSAEFIHFLSPNCQKKGWAASKELLLYSTMWLMHCNIPFKLKIVSLKRENFPREKIMGVIKSEGKQSSLLPPAHTDTRTAPRSKEIKQENSPTAFLGEKKKKKGMKNVKPVRVYSMPSPVRSCSKAEPAATPEQWQECRDFWEGYFCFSSSTRCTSKQLTLLLARTYPVTTSR